MAASKKYLSLEEAAALLKLKNEELIRFREKGDIRGFADRGNWKFKADDVEEFRRRRQPDSDPDMQIMDDDDLGERLMSDPELQISSSSENALDDDDELGRQATIIRKGRESTSDSDVRLVLDDGLRGRLTGSSGELPVIDMGRSDSDVRLVGDSEIKLRPDSDSDVKLVNPLGLRPDSDSDVKLVNPSGLGSVSGLNDSDSDVRMSHLSDSDSDVRLAPLSGGLNSGGRFNSGGRRPSGLGSGLRTDSDITLMPPMSRSAGSGDGGDALDFNLIDDGPGASALLDDDDVGIVLPGDSGIALSGDSGIQLRMPADSGILLEGADSGIRLSTGDSNIKLGGDSGFRLSPLGGSSIKLKGNSSIKLKGGSSKKLKGRQAQDDLGSTAPMLLASGNDDDLNSTSPMLLSNEDDLSSTDLDMPPLSADEGGSDMIGGRTAAIVMFDDDDDDDATGTLKKTGGKKSSGDSGFDFDDEADEELEVSDDVLGEDDELEDLDAFDSDDDEFDESFESGASQLGFGRRQDKLVAPQEAEWGTGFFLGLLASTFVLMVGALLSVDLLRTTWAGSESAVYQGEFIGMFAGLFQ